MAEAHHYVGRFAPTPSGDLHLGSLATALASWLRARGRGGLWRVRVDDIDPPREVPGSAHRILMGLRRCGLRPDGEVVYQSRHGADYARALATLEGRGLVFPCWCSRQDLAAHGGLHRHGRCVRGPIPGREPALRLRTPAGVVGFVDLFCGPQNEDVAAAVGDVVLRRADGVWSYHLACAVDEAGMGISEVIRGRDLLDSTARQILLMQLLDLPVPRYGHIPLVLDDGGRKLCKSSNNAPLDFNEPGVAVRRALAHLGLHAPSPLQAAPALLEWARQAAPARSPEAAGRVVDWHRNHSGRSR